MNIFNPSLAPGAQIFSIPGGVSGSAKIYLKFSSTPSAGSVTFEIQRPGSSEWLPVQNGALISLTSGLVSVLCDGGFSAIRLSFAGLSGGTSAILAIVANETATPPSDLLTDGGFGTSRRLRVDPGQTGFFAGKFFRSYAEASIPTGGPSFQLRFTSPVDFILWSQVLTLTQGAVEFRVYTGAAGSGAWTDLSPIGVNRMAARPQPYYTAQARLATGGNFTGGTEVDLIKIRTSAQNATASNIQESASERGLPAGTYFMRIQTLTGGVTVNDAAQLIYTLLWEERP